MAERTYNLSDEQLENMESIWKIKRFKGETDNPDTRIYLEDLEEIFAQMYWLSQMMFHTVSEVEDSINAELQKAKIQDFYDLYKTQYTIISKVIGIEHERDIDRDVSAELARARGEDYEPDDGYPDSATYYSEVNSG
mgnify:FL=1